MMVLPLFEWSRLSIRCLNVHGNAVKDGFAKRKIHPLLGIKLMIGIAGIQWHVKNLFVDFPQCSDATRSV